MRKQKLKERENTEEAKGNAFRFARAKWHLREKVAEKAL